MATSNDPTATELVASIVEVLDQIRSTEGVPEATRETCDHRLTSVHESMHGLALWLHELLEWAPLQPQTRASTAHLAKALTTADAGFHATRK